MLGFTIIIMLVYCNCKGLGICGIQKGQGKGLNAYSILIAQPSQSHESVCCLYARKPWRLEVAIPQQCAPVAFPLPARRLDVNGRGIENQVRGHSQTDLNITRTNLDGRQWTLITQFSRSYEYGDIKFKSTLRLISLWHPVQVWWLSHISKFLAL